MTQTMIHEPICGSFCNFVDIVLQQQSPASRTFYQKLNFNLLHFFPAMLATKMLMFSRFCLLTVITVLI